MTPRMVGSVLGVLIGMGLVVYLDKNDFLSRRRATKPAPLSSSTSAPLSQEDDKAMLRKLTQRQAEEIARLQRAKEANDALNRLRAPRSPRDPAQPELVRLRSLSPRELNSEIETAVEEVANYTAAGAYAPQRHADLYQRINRLWDIRGLTETQNRWLAKAVQELNELAVQHAEEAMASGDNDEVIRAAAGLGEWAFRLNERQRKRLIAAVESSAAKLR